MPIYIIRYKNESLMTHVDAAMVSLLHQCRLWRQSARRAVGKTKQDKSHR